MSDPAAMEGMMGMMKGNMAMMIPQTLIMGWINAFFSGFVISKFGSGVRSLLLPFVYYFGNVILCTTLLAGPSSRDCVCPRTRVDGTDRLQTCPWVAVSMACSCGPARYRNRINSLTVVRSQ
jgi:hypothetical protein